MRNRAAFAALLALMALGASPAGAQQQAPGSSYAAGTACSTSGNFLWPDTYGQILKCNGSTWAVNIGTATSGMTGSGSTSYDAIWTSPTALGTGLLYESGSSVGIGTTSPNASATLDLSHNTNSMLLPVGTTGQEPTGVAGMVRYNSTISNVEYYNGSAWTPFKPSGPPPGSGMFVQSAGYFSGCLGQGVNSISYSGTTATLTTYYNLPHDLTTGTSVTISGATPSAYNGTFTIIVINASQFSYTMGSNPGSNDSTTSATTYCPASGGLATANAMCLADLTNNTNWWGYSQINKQGLLNSSHVTAWLCDGTNCNDAEASKNYYFADALDNSTGGAYFTTNASGYGAGDALEWTLGNHFGGYGTNPSGAVGNYWTGRGGGSGNYWGGTQTGAANTCSGWTSNSSGGTGVDGIAARTDYGRWAITTRSCNTAYNLVCLVNP